MRGLQFFLVHTVGNSVARVELDGGEDSLPSRGNSSNSWGSSISGWGHSSNSWSSSICGRSNSGNSRGSSISGRGHSSNSWGSSISGRGSSITSITSIRSRSISIDGLSRPLDLGSSIVGLEEASLGSSNLGGVNNRGRGSTSVDRGNRGNSRVDRGNRQVVSSHTEAKVISNVIDSVDSGLINIGVGSSHSTSSIATLFLSTVGVLVTIGNVAKLILSLELGGGNSWGSHRGSNSSDSWGSSHRGSSNSDRGNRGRVSCSIGGRGSSNSWGSSNNRGSSIGSCGNSRGSSSNRAGSQGTSIEGSDRGSIGKLSINI